MLNRCNSFKLAIYAPHWAGGKKVRLIAEDLKTKQSMIVYENDIYFDYEAEKILNDIDDMMLLLCNHISKFVYVQKNGMEHEINKETTLHRLLSEKNIQGSSEANNALVDDIVLEKDNDFEEDID